MDGVFTQPGSTPPLSLIGWGGPLSGGDQKLIPAPKRTTNMVPTRSSGAGTR